MRSVLTAALAACALLPGAEPATGAGIDAAWCGWRIETRLADPGDPRSLRLVASGGAGSPAWFTVELPDAANRRRLRLRVQAPGRHELDCAPLLPEPLNPANRYRVAVIGEGDDGARLRVLSPVAGGDRRFGDPVAAAALPDSGFGTQVHFGKSDRPTYAGWADADGIIDRIAAAGLTWIRCGLNALDRGPDGGHLLRAHDRAWMQKARARGLRIQLCIPMLAKETQAEFVARASAIAAQTSDLVDILELGNEPFTHGGWRPEKYPKGDWNGKTLEGNRTAEWVHRFLAYTNAGAEAIARVRPGVAIIAGADIPTANFRMLDLGLSPAITGIKDHPYGITPETMPFGAFYNERDGVEVGDERGNLVAYWQSYRHRLAALGRDLDLYASEFGWTTCLTSKHQAGLSESGLAAFLVRQFLLQAHLGVKVQIQYAFMDDFRSDQHDSEANFGLLRGDGSPKPAYQAVQRMTSLFSGWRADPAATVSIERQDLPTRGGLARTWIQTAIPADNRVYALPFHAPGRSDERILAVWSALPSVAPFSDRLATIRIAGWPKPEGIPVAVRVCAGGSFDLPVSWEDGSLWIRDLRLDDDILAIRIR